MNKTIARDLVLNLGLFALMLLIILSIAGAFLGADKASMFFNSPPLAVFWIFLTGLFCTAFFFWKSLYRRVNLLLCHAGCVAVLVGGLWGSAAAHRLRASAGISEKLTKGTIILRQGQTGNQVMLADQTGTFALPFEVHLEKTQVTFYDEGIIAVYDAGGRFLGTIPAEVGDVYELPVEPPARVRVAKQFENLRLQLHPEGGVQPVEGEPDQSNPGYEVLIQTAEGQQHALYVFEQFEPHFLPNVPFLARFIKPRNPREYTSHLVLKKDGRVLTEKTIRVNDPLYYGGYHFYQSDFGQDQFGPYSSIMIVSDSGVRTVFAGYALITLGLFGQFWVKPLLHRRAQRGADAH